MDAADPYPQQNPLCAFCGGDVTLMEAIVYHGVVYHPACVAPTTARGPAIGVLRPSDGRPQRDG